MVWLSNIFSTQPHWFINILIGSFIGLILPYLLRSFVYIFRLLKKEFLTGKWYGYYFITEAGETRFYSDENIIKKGFLNKLVISAKRIDEASNKESNYKGYIFREGGYFGNYLLVKLTKVETGENIFYRYVYPHPHSKMTMGLWLALDYDGIVTVGTKVLSRERLAEEEVKEVLKKVVINEEYKTLRLLHMIESN